MLDLLDKCEMHDNPNPYTVECDACGQDLCDRALDYHRLHGCVEPGYARGKECGPLRPF